MTDGRLRVVLAGSPYPQPDGPRPFLEESGFEVLSEVSGREELFRVLREDEPDLLVLGPELIERELVQTARDLAPGIGLVAVVRGRVPKALVGQIDGQVPYGAPLGSLTAELARVAVIPADPRSMRGRLGRSRTLLAAGRIAPMAAAVAIVTGAWILFATFPEGQLPPRADGTPPGATSAPTGEPGATTSAPTPVGTALEALDALVGAIGAGDYELAVAQAERLVQERERAIEQGFDVASLDASVAAALGTAARDLPASVVTTLRAVLGALLPSAGEGVVVTGDGRFGDVPVGTTSGPILFHAANLGPESTRVLVEVLGPSADRFSLAGGCDGRTLPPDEGCTIEVTFRPSAVGQATAQLRIASEDGPPFTLALSGTGILGPTENEPPVPEAPDTEPPILLCDPVGGGWHGSDVIVSCRANDAGSGLADPGLAAFVLRTSTPAGTETSSARTDSRRVCDLEGNCATVGPIGGIKVDKRAPDVTCDRPGSGWHGENVVVDCAARDRGSGMRSDARFELSTNVPRDDETADAETRRRSVCDRAGNCTTAGPIGGIKVDRKSPRVSCDGPGGGWHAENVRVACDANDGGSGVTGGDSAFTLATEVAAGTETADARTGTREICDRVGNCTTAGPIGGIKVDRKAPEITITAPSSGSVFLLDESVTTSFACTDGGAGTVICQGSGNVDTTSVGERTFAVTARDAVGNEATQRVAYLVTYGVQLLSDPGKAGNKVHFRLVNASGANESSPRVGVTAVDLDGEPLKRRLAYNPGQRAYRLNLPGNIEDGQHVLRFRAEGDPIVHSVTFTTD